MDDIFNRLELSTLSHPITTLAMFAELIIPLSTGAPGAKSALPTTLTLLFVSTKTVAKQNFKNNFSIVIIERYYCLCVSFVYIICS